LIGPVRHVGAPGDNGRVHLRFRDATPEDWPGIWPFWHRIVAAGETYAWDPATDERTARALWLQPPPARVYVAEDADTGRIVGSAVLKPNAATLGDHVANASFMVDPDLSGRGIGRRLAEYVLAEARREGYRAMQFNAVVEANEGAVALWLALGFEILGTVPEAFRHARLGPVGLHVMYRRL
jgi:L-amino acid N-acyltransferase YncA